MNDNTLNLFDDVDSVIDEPLKFKAKLAIGEDAYTSLKVKNKVMDAWEAYGVGTAAVTVAKSSAVASTFFAPSGLLGVVGLGTAVTPVGWVVAAGVVSAGAWIGVTRYLKGEVDKRVTVVPEFINTPLDILGIALFDLIVPLALKLSAIDGVIDRDERAVIRSYFVNEWGYDGVFTDKGMAYVEENLSEYSISDLAKKLAEYKKSNPDCNYSVMSQDTLNFLNDIMEADGKIDEREKAVINVVEDIFSEEEKINVGKNIKNGLGAVSESIEGLINKGLDKVRNESPK